MPQSASESLTFAAAARTIEAVDTRHARTALSDPRGSTKWNRFRVNEVELEWRRWRLRALLGYDDQAARSLHQYEAAAVAAGLPPRVVAPERLEPERDYDQMFPQGQLIMPAMPARVLRPADDQAGGRNYELKMTQSAQRRANYLDLLGETPRAWNIPNLLDRRTRTACRWEAAALPEQPHSNYRGGEVHGWDTQFDALLSRSHTTFLGEGPVLSAIHEDPVLLDELSVVLGRRMYPTRCTYLPYACADYLGVHTDQPNCEISLLFTIDGEPGPLRSYFEHTTWQPHDLNRWVQDEGNFPDGGDDYVYGEGEAFALTGRVVPHARLTQRDPALIGALFYSGVV